EWSGRRFLPAAATARQKRSEAKVLADAASYVQSLKGTVIHCGYRKPVRINHRIRLAQYKRSHLACFVIAVRPAVIFIGECYLTIMTAGRQIMVILSPRDHQTIFAPSWLMRAGLVVSIFPKLSLFATLRSGLPHWV